MSEIKHTATPWRITESTGDRGEKYKDIVNENGEYVREENYIGDDDLRRIVACVNELEGLTTEQIEEGAFKKMREDRDLLLAQRDQLMEALKVAEKALSHCKPDVGYSSKHTDASIAINRAIAAVEKSK